MTKKTYTEEELQQIINTLTQKRPRGRPKGTKIARGPVVQTSGGKPRGRPKGVEKAPGSGRKKGSLNKKTLLKLGLNSLSAPTTVGEGLTEARYAQLLEQIWKCAIQDGSLTAARLWFDIYNLHVRHSLQLKVTTFDDIEKAAQVIIDAVCAGHLPIPQGKDLMYILHLRKAFREAALEPVVEKFMEDQKNKYNQPYHS